MPDFWTHSGYHLLRRGDDGKLVVTDDFLRAYLQRPEVGPVETSCDAERALHVALIEDPRAAVPPERLAQLAEPDARENYEVLLALRDRLVAAGTVEDCYLNLFLEDRVTLPSLFVDQLVHVCLRGILDGADPLRARAGELLFRSQKVSVNDGAVMVADEETVEMYGATGGFGDLGRLVVEAQAPVRSIELDVLGEDNAELYWQRDERHDTVLDLAFARPGLDAFCRVLEAWILHFTGAATRITPVGSISDERWVWHVGLDVEASAILNDLYNDVEVDPARLERLLALFRLEFDDPSLMLPRIAGRPVYLAMAMNAENVLRLKPQNILVNLPFAARA
jgi:hypothetical protein